MKEWRLGESDAGAFELLPYTISGPLIRDILEASVFLYNSGIVHLDMKLDNLFIRDDGSLAIGDLGEAKILVG